MIKKKNGECLTMYIKNRRDSVKSKDFGSYQTLCLTENLLLRIAYFSYTKRYLPYENRTTDKKLEVCGRHYDDKGLQTSY